MTPLIAVAMPHLAGVGLVVATLFFLALGQVGEGAPAPAAAPAASETGGEPAEGAAAAGAETDAKGKPPAEKKPRTIDDDIEDVFKKHGGYEYAKGKKLDSAANLKRMLGRGSANESVTSEALKVKAAEAERKQLIEQIEAMKPGERKAALEKMGFSPKTIKAIRETFEDDILSEDERARAEAGMTERERMLARKAEEQDRELQTFRQKEEQAQAEQKEQAFMAETEGLLQELEQTAIKGLERAGITNADRPLVLALLPALAAEMGRAKALGLELDPAELAEVATKERAKLSDDWNAARPLEDLSASLEAIQTTEDDPHRPGQKLSRLRQLMLHEAAKIRAKVTGGQPVPVRAAVPRQNNGSSQSMSDKIAAARTFGGGSR